MTTPFRLRYTSRECDQKCNISLVKIYGYTGLLHVLLYYSLLGVSKVIGLLYGPVSILLTAAT